MNTPTDAIPTLPQHSGSGTAARWVVPLPELRRSDAALAGAKAANLGELVAAGFPVPDGVVLTTAAFEQALGLVDEGARLADAPLPADVVAAIQKAVVDLGNGALAVRSSADSEDGSDASFAGQYDTVLEVAGVEATLDAVRQCWASAFGERVVAYRRERGLGPARMAVLIQRMVPADAAGVAFTANPVNGARDECLVSAVRGLGDRLVSGEATPDEWAVRGDEVRAISQVEGALDEARVQQIASLARRAEHHFGAPQDVEWAMSDGTVHVLQSRPITSLAEPPIDPVPIPIEPPEGPWEREASHWPDPPTPLYEELFVRMEPAMASGFAEAGMLLNGIRFAVIGGNVYQQFIGLDDKPIKSPPKWLVPIIMPVLRRVIPSLRRRIAHGVEAVRTDWHYRTLIKWRDSERAELMRANAALRDVKLETLTDGELLAHLERVVAHAGDTMGIHIRAANGFVGILWELASFAERELGWGATEVVEVCGGTSELSTAPARALAALADMAAERPAVRAAIEGEITADFESRLERADAGFAAHWQKFVAEYGCRPLKHADLIEPTLGERPELIASLIRGQLERRYDSDAVQQEAERRAEELLRDARAKLQGRPDTLAKLERRVYRGRLAYSLREDNTFHTQGVPLAIWRRTALEMGRRLVLRGDIDAPDDVLFFHYAELPGVWTDAADRRALVRRRRGERAWAQQNDAPAFLGPRMPNEPPPMGWMPPEVRTLNEAFMWIIQHVTATQVGGRSQDGEGGIDGIGASRGTYEGTVRVIADESEFHKLQPGDVLVCTATSPVWSVLFPHIGALVTDAGGTLSHQAIIAREYGVPAVVATGNATSLLCDGDRVRVDGARGHVEVLS